MPNDNQCSSRLSRSFALPIERHVVQIDCHWVLAAGLPLRFFNSHRLLAPVPLNKSIPHTDAESEPVAVRVLWKDGIAPPPLGFSMSTCSAETTDAAIDRLASLRPRHLRVDLRLCDLNWPAAASDAIALASHIGCQLEVAVHTDGLKGSNWQRCIELLVSQRNLVARLLIFHPRQKSTSATLARAAVDILQDAIGNVQVVVGTDAYFAELNRNRPKVREPLQVCYSINPQVHAFDKLSLCETIEHRETPSIRPLQCSIVRSSFLRSPCDRDSIRMQLRCRMVQVEPETDPRQQTDFAAAWTTGVLGQLATHPHVASLTFFETWGPRGVMDESGNAYPMSQVFAEYLKAATVFPVATSRPLEISAIGLIDADGHRRVLIGNMSHRPLSICLDETTRHEVAAESVAVLEMAVTKCENAACQKIHSTSVERSV